MAGTGKEEDESNHNPEAAAAATAHNKTTGEIQEVADETEYSSDDDGGSSSGWHVGTDDEEYCDDCETEYQAAMVGKANAKFSRFMERYCARAPPQHGVQGLHRR